MSCTLTGSQWKIVVLNNGFIIVGTITQMNDIVVVRNCRCIERWGTTKGLGELVNGPTGATKLAKQGDTQVHILCVTQFIDVDSEKWTKVA